MVGALERPEKGVREREARDSRFSDKENAPPVVRLPVGSGASVSSCSAILAADTR